MRIVNLEVENVKRIRVARIKPDGSLVMITGKNAQGKTSILDAIEMTLAGKGSSCPKPLRKGSKKGRCVVDLGEIRVMRKWTQKGSTLVVEEKPKDGEKKARKLASPQQVLSELIGKISFDPLAFMRMKPAEQAKVLRDIAGLDFAEMDARRKELFEERTDVNREVKRLETSYDSLGDLRDTPKERIDIGASIDELNKMTGEIRRKEEIEMLIDQKTAELDRLKNQIKAIEGNLAGLKEELGSITSTVEDLAELRETVSGAERSNELYQKAQQAAQVHKSLEESRDRADDLTRKIEEIDAKKTELLENAEMPLENLALSEEGEVTWSGLPISQTSQAEQIQISASIGMALNPKLRVLLIRDGSLLDEDSMKMLAAFAESSDAQVWIERVAGDQPVGVVIEDGEVAGAAKSERDDDDDDDEDQDSDSDEDEKKQEEDLLSAL